MNRKVIILGAGGFSTVIADIINICGDKLVGFLDDDTSRDRSFAGSTILGPLSDYVKYPDCTFVLGLGNIYTREKIVNTLVGVRWYTAIHPKSVISSLNTSVGEGTVVFATAVINPGSHIGRHCIINTGTIVDHDCTVDDFTHISAGAVLAGTVHIGSKTFIGISSGVRNNTSVCGDCVIGAGAIVVKNITEPGTYVGVPARKIK